MATVGTTQIQELTDEQAWERFDQEAQRWLHMSGQAFIEAWKKGTFAGEDRPEVIQVATLLPWVDPELLYMHVK